MMSDFPFNALLGKIIYTVDVDGNPVPVGPDNPIPMSGGGSGEVADGSITTAKFAASAKAPLAGTADAAPWAGISGKPAVIAAGADAAAARTAIGAGTSSLALGTTAGTAKAGDYAPPLASAAAAGVVKKAAHVDPATATVADLANALIAAGIMA